MAGAAVDRHASTPRHVLAQVVADEVVPATAPAALVPGRAFLARQPNLGYQPIIRAMNMGALLQVTPTLIPNTRSVALDLQSIVSRWHGDEDAPVPFIAAPLDRLNIVTQQFMTTLRVPMGQPVLVAGLTLEPIAAAAVDEQLYLVIEASLGADARPRRE